MNELAHIVQLIATAINSKLTLTLSQRIARLSSEMKANSGGFKWIDRTPAGLTNSHRQQMERSGESVSKASQYKNEAHQRFSSARDAVTAESLNPTGMSPAHLDQLKQAADIYRLQLNDASDNLKKVTGEHEKLREAIAKQIASAKGMTAGDIGSLRSASQRTAKSSSRRDAIQDKLISARDAVTKEFLNPTGISAKQFARMNDAVQKYSHDLSMADIALKKSVEAEAKLQKTVLDRAKAQGTADDRRPTSKIGQALRKVDVAFRKMLGPRGRKALKPLTDRMTKARKAIDKARDAISPKKSRERIKKARETAKTTKSEHQQAQAEHQKAIEAHQNSPTADTQKGVEDATANVAKTGEAAAAASEELAAAESMGLIAEAAGGLVEALGPVGVAIGLVASAAIAAVAYINRELEAGKKEVERFRQERSTYSSQIANAVMQYEMQSRQLEQRSSAATSGSAVGVVNSTMDLRESLQERNEKWESLGNRILDLQIQIATSLNNAIAKPMNKAIDYLDDIVVGLHVIGEWFGILNKIEENTDKDKGPALEGLLNQQRGNANMRGNQKRQNRGLPPLK